jgi:ABC-type antimicrobial peptide transport system permease subunit
LFAAVGLYGVVAFMVAQRRREFGVRMALGARGVDIVRLVLARGLTVAGSGMIAGILLAVGTAALLRSVLYGISPGDPLSWSVAAMIVLTVSVLAHVVPARRAVAVDPARTLTAE